MHGIVTELIRQITFSNSLVARHDNEFMKYNDRLIQFESLSGDRMLTRK